MATTASPFDPDLTQEEIALQRRQGLAQMLQQQANTPLGPTEMVSGRAVRQSPLEGVNKLLQAYLAGKMGSENDATAQSLMQRNAQAKANTLADALKLYSGTTDPAIEAPSAELGGGPGRPEIRNPGNPLAAALKLSANPNTASLGAAMLPEAMKLSDGGEVTYHDSGQYLVGTSKNGKVVSMIPKQASADTVYNKTTQSADAVLTHTTPSADASNRLSWDQYLAANPTAIQRAQLANEGIGLGIRKAELGFNTGQGAGNGGVSLPPAAPMPNFMRVGGTGVPPVPVPGGVAPQGQPPMQQGQPPVQPGQPSGIPQQMAAAGGGGMRQPVAPTAPTQQANVPLVFSPTIAPKEKQALALAQPTATTAARTSLQATDRLVDIAGELKDHAGLDSIVGKVNQYSMFDVTPQTRDARALQNTLVNQVGIQALNTMREQSKTGGAVGQVTEREWPILQQSLSALSDAQSTDGYKTALTNLIAQVKSSQANIRAAYESTYGSLKYSPPAHTNLVSAQRTSSGSIGAVDTSNPLLKNN